MTRRQLALFALMWFALPIAAQQPAKPPPLPAIDPAQARLDQTIGGLDGPGFAIAADPQSDFLAAACQYNTVQYWKRDVILGVRAGDRTSQVLEGHQGPVTAVAWIDHAKLATAGADSKILIWAMPEGTLLQTLPATAVVRTLCASPDGKLLASAEEASIQLWDVASGKAVRKPAGHTDWVLSLAFSADSKRLASGGYDGTLRSWDVASGKQLWSVEGKQPPAANAPPTPANTLYSVAFSPDGNQIVAGGADARIYQFNAADGKFVRPFNGHDSSIASLVYHPGGTVVVSAGRDRTVRIWNPANGQLLKTLEGHTAWVQGVTFLEQGTRLASVGADQTVRLWDLAKK